MYEHRSHPLLPKANYYKRLARNFIWGSGVILFSLSVGMAGYHYFENIGWIDSLLNASMILTGMGPVNTLHTTAGKLFASFYALFSGVVFLTFIAFILAPVVHRLLHTFHLDEDEKQ
jgi:hypothetical protein